MIIRHRCFNHTTLRPCSLLKANNLLWIRWILEMAQLILLRDFVHLFELRSKILIAPRKESAISKPSTIFSMMGIAL